MPSFPDRIIVECKQAGVRGLAVSLQFPCQQKNDFSYTVFLNESGRAELTGEEILRCFDRERQVFLMDYEDPRTAWDGRVLAHAMSRDELSSALSAFNLYRDVVEYPDGYKTNLLAAADLADYGPYDIRVARY
jgi:hypothetical protein